MRNILFLLGSLLGTLILAAAQPYNYGVDIESLTRRQEAGSRVVVRPLPLSRNGSVPLRPEIRQMKADRYKWDLFILALSMFQYVSQDDPTSWYQIAEIYRMANGIAGMYPNGTERQAYLDAAHNFRMPYWDWAIGAPEGEDHFPEVFWNATISQDGPRGVQNIRNPLYAYQFHPKDEDAFIWSPLRSWDETKRAPDTAVSETSPPSNNEQVNEALLSKLPEIQQRLFILFSSYKDFNNFGNKAWAVTQNLSTLDSIEAIHDIVHIYGGLKGHMTYVPLSSFDPLFFLHHAMTDRLVAMWQVLNPDSWMTPMPAGETSFTTTKGEMQDSTTPLTPFFASDDGTFWTSDMSRTTEAFGYAYADTDSSNTQGQQLRDELIKKITKWYGESSLVGLQAKKRRLSRHFPARRPVKPRGEHFHGGRPNVRIDAEDPPFALVVKNGWYTEWVANVQVNVEALDGNFQVHFFFGEPPSDRGQWNFASNLAGTVAIFAMNRQTGSETMISGTAPLTSALMKMVAAGEIPNLEPRVSKPFLRETLQFRVLGSDGEEVDPREVAGLYVGISSSQVKTPEKDTELPKWGPMVSRIDMWP
ncbi:hypothetical protein ACJ41O_011170 [Fusarium nematophilum]